MNSDRITRKKAIKVVALIILFAVLFLTAILCLSRWEKQHYQSGESTLSSNADGSAPALNENIETVLVMGIDKFEESIDNSSYNNNQQADFLMLLVLDNEKSTCTAIHLNRDTMAEVPVLGVAGQKIGTQTEQIALAHTYGSGKQDSCNNTVDAVSKLLGGVQIDHYISLTMDAVQELNDLVGGVEVTVLDDFTGIDETLKKGEKVTLKGEHALNYVRTRYGVGDSSNAQRMKRQAQYLEALYGKIKMCAEDDEKFIVDATLQISDYMVSDCTVNQLQDILEQISVYEFTEIRTIEGESVVGEEFMEFYADEDSIKSITSELFYK